MANGGPNPLQRADAAQRDGEIALLYTGGATLEEIGNAIGVSRERVRQRLVRAGITERHHRHPNHADPLLICREAEVATSGRDLARRTGRTYDTCRKVLNALGKWEAFSERCWVARTTETRRRLLSRLRQVGQELGRTPSQHDLQARGIAHTGYYIQFGSLARAQALAGFRPRAVGHRGHTNPRWVSPEDQAVMRSQFQVGKSIGTIARETGRAWGTVKRIVLREGHYAPQTGTTPEPAARLQDV